MRSILVFCVLFLIISFSNISEAESIKLAGGTPIQGEIVDYDKKGISIKVINTKRTIKLRWSQISKIDRKRLWKKLGLQKPDFTKMVTVKGDRIELKDGRIYMGKIVSNSKFSLKIEFLDTYGEKDKKSISKWRIRQIFRNITIPPQILLTKEKIYELIIKKNPPDDGKSHYLLAQYCEEIGLYKEGFHHIEKALKLEPTLDKQAIVLLESMQKLFTSDGIHKQMIRINE